MAVGDLFWFSDAVPVGFPASSAFSSGDDMRAVLITNASVTSTESTLSYTAYTEASTATVAGYESSGFQLEAWGAMWSTGSAGASKVATFDTTATPTWAQDAGHSTNVTYCLIANISDTSKRAVCAIDLGGVDMTAGDLTITFNASGIATITST
jgi:hypothetical protein